MIKELDALIEALADSEEVKRYKLIEDRLSHNEKMKAKIAEFKKLQQKMALAQYRGEQLPSEVQIAYDALYEELLDIPIFNELMALQNDINTVVREISAILETELNKNDA